MTLAQRFVLFWFVTVSRQATASRYVSSLCSQYTVNWSLTIGTHALNLHLLELTLTRTYTRWTYITVSSHGKLAGIQNTVAHILC